MIKKSIYYQIFVTVISAVHIFAIASDKIPDFLVKKGSIKQHKEENLLNSSNSEDRQIIKKNIYSTFQNKINLKQAADTQLKTFTNIYISSINRINKYPRWSRSTFS